MKNSLVFFTLIILCFAVQVHALKVTGLTCNGAANPLGIDREPSLSWILKADERGQHQTAYQLQIARSLDDLLKGDAGLVYDDKKATSQSAHIKPEIGLESGVRYFWRVRVWDRENQVSGWSEPAWFESGLLDESDWRAQWISAPPLFDWQAVDGRRKRMARDAAPELPEPAPLFRAEFFIDKKVENARAYICGLGYHELYLNGQKVGDHLLDPAFTRYDVRALYVTHDVTGQLKRGDNAVGVMLGTGWYDLSSRGVWGFDYAAWRDRPAVICQIRIQFKDGSVSTIVTDPSWRCAPGPVTFNSIRQGEWYDARREIPGWNRAGLNDSNWFPVRKVRGPEGELSAQNMPPVRIHQSLKPKTVTRIDSGHYLVDFGQNMAGFAELALGGRAGDEVTLVYAEKIQDGRADQSNIDRLVASTPFQTDRYILKGGGEERWHARFTYHGFQYVEVSGFPGELKEENLTAHAISTAFDQVSTFECSNELINRIQRSTLWSYRNNFVGYPTDCPQREKNGWTGDAQLAAEAGLFNFASASAYYKWIQDIADEQRQSGEIAAIVPTAGWGYYWGNGPAWDSAFILIPYYLYLYTGDLSVIERHYDQMKSYVDFLAHEKSEDGIVSWGLSDWCYEKTQTPPEITSTAYYYVDTRLIAYFAGLLGRTADADKYARLAGDIRAAFAEKFVNLKKGSIGNDSQTALACAVYQGLVEPPDAGAVIETLKLKIAENDNRLDFGILGAKYVLNALAEQGNVDVAYRLFNHSDYPGWGHWISRGATTLWEDWKGASSRSHIMFGDVSAWLYKYIAGIQPDPAAPGFEHFFIQPFFPDDMEWAGASVRSPFGPIKSGWRWKDGKVFLNISVPVNSTATVRLPAESVTSVSLCDEPDQYAKRTRFEDGMVEYTIQSGEYCFRIDR